jgi:predicted aspartyl protease
VGTFYYPVEVGDPLGLYFERVEALVDTGAIYSAFPASQLLRLGVTPHDRRRLKIGSGRSIDFDLGRTWIRLDGKPEIVLVLFGDEELGPVLGAHSLEAYSLGVDPVGKRLIPVEGVFLSLFTSSRGTAQ